jgi:hypothetical protein
MAAKPLNSIEGFSVSENEVQIVFANGHISVASLLVSGETNLGPISNVSITGGSSGQVISTDGLGNLSFSSVASGAGGNLEVYTRSSEIIKIPIDLGVLSVAGRTGNIAVPIV